jgi:hypothetical protein
MNVTGKPINLEQLQGELATAGVSVPNGLGLSGPAADSPTVSLLTFDVNGTYQDVPPEAAPVVQAHIAMRDKTDEEYAIEFQNPNTTAERRQEMRDITSGLLSREQVRVDGQPMEPPPPPPDPLTGVKAATGVEGLRDALVAYFETR